ncbi:hypothetical protein LTR99_008557 [Exophiala xenobiotica]|uniref:CID domain-containing protein n=1 Tax=Vermiconidia calcicola TaxID=1690605 RepID=A0AAV9Q0R2_9PEZI|nr:hypothetical protein LTR92_008296 [Exophiala xenobiotica]KAK5296916.1 hypothetical protein LTR99_008557 [Exophiala xenobiotica]KAK5428654.1 hypothetical protein LTR34_007820 [Exophiala xenobiotica]KAK5532947.1 hypothetical protein LTR25_007651 [Vermiconidia calcicola]KAK5546677.1 hypothetical protein LTR23_003424 [Chaetothyriales sp. CCFEE 6169]
MSSRQEIVVLMAAHHISLAKAAFGASLFRPDVTKVTRDDLTKFHEAFEATLAHCSRHNIQTCKEWLLGNVTVSSARTAAFGKFLATVSKHIVTAATETAKPSSRRQRLHILYLLNDLLHHAKFHASERSFEASLTQLLQPFLRDLFQLAAEAAKPRVSRRLRDVVKIWEEAQYFERDVLAQLLDPLDNVASEATQKPLVQTTSKPTTKELPFILPALHGDPSSPFYDLPAGNLMPLIVPNSLQSIRPEEIRPLQLSSGPADEGLVNALKDFLHDVKGLDNTVAYLEDKGMNPEIDEMGQISYRDEAGDVVGDTYYGWSRSFCAKMKRRDGSRSDGSSRRSRSRSTTRSRSRGGHKRRRYSDSLDNGSSRSYSRSTSRRRYNHSRKRSSRSRSPDDTSAARNEVGLASSFDGRRLYIGKLDYAATEADVKQFFSGYDVESVALPTKAHTNRAAGYAFVTLRTADEARKAIQNLSGRDILQRKVSIQLARMIDAIAIDKGGSRSRSRSYSPDIGGSNAQPPLNSAPPFPPPLSGHTLPPRPPSLLPGGLPVPPPHWQGSWPPPPPPPPPPSYYPGNPSSNNIPFPPPPLPNFAPPPGAWPPYPQMPQTPYQQGKPDGYGGQR